MIIRDHFGYLLVVSDCETKWHNQKQMQARV